MSQGSFTKYNETINAIVGESIRCSPASWDFGTLTIDCDGRAIDYSLRNEKDENKAKFSNDLCGLCEELYMIMRSDGDVWIQSIIYFFKKNSTWAFELSFKYDYETQ